MPAATIEQKVIDLSALLLNVSLENPSKDESSTSLNCVTANLIVDCHCELGEGILFDEKSDTILWTDILGKRFHKLELNYNDPRKSIHVTYQLPKMLGSFGMLASVENTKKDDIVDLPLLCAWEDGFQMFDVAKGQALSSISIGEDVNPVKGPTRLNDGRADPAGNRFICGGYYGEQPETRMKVFKVEQRDNKQLRHEPIVEGIRVTNSICWSLDGNTMYLGDSPTRKIHSYTYDRTSGKLSGKKLLHTKTETKASVPDGSCVDKEGYIWNAVWRDGEAPGMVQRIDPSTGEVVFTVNMPDTTSQVSCCCFGGKELDILYITTAAVSRNSQQEPHAGGLYAIKLPFTGCPESRLKFQL